MRPPGPPRPYEEAAEIQAEADRPVTVASFLQPIEAHLARARLESDGIECFVVDEHIVGVQWLYAVAVGGVKLQVRSWQSEHAREVLASCQAETRTSSDWITADLAAPRCPRCGSLRIEPSRLSRGARLASGLLLGLRLVGRRRDTRCRHCGHRWRGATSQDTGDTGIS